MAGQCAEIPRLQKPLDGEFPFQIEAYPFSSADSRSLEDGQNRLALLVPLNGWLRVDIAATGVDLCAGEILIAPNLNMVLRAGLGTTHLQVLVISFLLRFVYSLGSPSHDYFFLRPFHAMDGRSPQVVRQGPALREIHETIARLVQCYLGRTHYFEVGCKTLLLELLYGIGRQSLDAEWIRSQMIFQTAQAAKLAPVMEFVKGHYAEFITLKQAASLAKISVPQFVRVFKTVAGTSFVTYVTHVRLSRAARLLKGSSLTIAQVACEVDSLNRAISTAASRKHSVRHRESFANSEKDLAKGKCRRRYFRESIVFPN